MADAEQICTSWVDEHFNVVEYWETFEDREELRDWDAQHGKPDTTTLGSVLLLLLLLLQPSRQRQRRKRRKRKKRRSMHWRCPDHGRCAGRMPSVT